MSRGDSLILVANGVFSRLGGVRQALHLRTTFNEHGAFASRYRTECRCCQSAGARRLVFSSRALGCLTKADYILGAMGEFRVFASRSFAIAACVSVSVGKKES